MPQSQWQTIRDRKLAEIATRIPSEWLLSASSLPAASQTDITTIPETCGILSGREIQITNKPTARSLLTALHERRYTAVEVTTAFCKRAAISHQLTACLTEPLFASALNQARELDDHLARTGQLFGPLHGLPISVKDTFNIANIDSSIGIASLCFKPATENAPLVQMLLDAGAVIHCKTNVPQTLLALDSTNNIFGRVLNPMNRLDWTAGGSSGGEGVLVKMKGCVMGVGTDVGGSIRIPAMCNGVYGFKPSVGRVAPGGQETGQLPAAGKVGLEASVGPIARHMDDVGLFMEVVEGARMWETESGVLPGKWWSSHDAVDPAGKHDSTRGPSGKLTIGVIWSDGVTQPLPPVRRALQQTVATLQSKNIKVIDVNAPRFKTANPSPTNSSAPKAATTSWISSTALPNP